jgi:hypothetical protein
MQIIQNCFLSPQQPIKLKLKVKNLKKSSDCENLQIFEEFFDENSKHVFRVQISGPCFAPGVSDALPLEIFGPTASFDSDLPDDVTYFSNSDCDIEAEPNLDEKVV